MGEERVFIHSNDLCLAVFMQIMCYSWDFFFACSAFSQVWCRHIKFPFSTFFVLCFFSLYSCLLHIFLYNITPPQFQCHDTYIFPLLHLPLSFSPHVLTIRLASLIFSLMFATPTLIYSALIVSIVFIFPSSISTLSCLFILTSLVQPL